MAKESDRIKREIATHMKSVDYAEDKSAECLRKGKVAQADQWAAQAREENKIISDLRASLKRALAQEKDQK